ncbi:SAM-dependent methyltransferase [Actinoplanes sp. NPDC051633]|uniref:SAM-dependent methyltransferase n=1 Tax=Actinoplanes sp. NPDC051633 TaxID=3155670 RepID=UPI003432D7D1
MSEAIDGSSPSSTARFDSGVPHPARVEDYWLGGKDNFAADRAVADQVAKISPVLPIVMRAERQFLGRMVKFLAGEAGIRQFLDIGTGIPMAANTHEVAQGVSPDCRVVYVDNDPLVLAHARALLVGTPEGLTQYIDADLREPEAILTPARQILDFDQPVAVTLLGVLEFVRDDEGVYAIVEQLRNALPVGSYVGVASSVPSPEMDEAARLWNESGATPITLRAPDDLARFLDGLDLIAPGVVPLPQWRPDSLTQYLDREMPQYGGLGIKTR